MKELKIGDKIFLQNDSGLLELTIDKELDKSNIQCGNGTDNLGAYESLRIEQYRSLYNSNVFTFYDNKKGNMNMTIMKTNLDDTKFYACHFDKTEQDLYIIDKE